MGDGILSEIEGAVTGGNAQGGIEGELIQGAEGMIQQKTGFDVSSLLGGGGGQQGGQQNTSSDDSSSN